MMSLSYCKWCGLQVNGHESHNTKDSITKVNYIRFELEFCCYGCSREYNEYVNVIRPMIWPNLYPYPQRNRKSK